MERRKREGEGGQKGGRRERQKLKNRKKSSMENTFND